MNKKLQNKLKTNFLKIKNMQKKINLLRNKSYDIIKYHTINLNKEEKAKLISYLYWNFSDISPKKLAEEIFNIKTHELRLFITPVVSNIKCIKCTKSLVANSRNQLNEYLRRGKQIKDYIYKECFNEDCNQRAIKNQKQVQDIADGIEYLRHLPYLIYLESAHWKHIRKIMLRRANYRCQLCNNKDILNVHHRTYKNKGNENYADLIVLCKSCHRTYHQKNKENTNV